MGAPMLKPCTSSATLMWSLWACVQMIHFTRRPSMASTMGPASWAASMTTHSRSLPTTQMLFSTSKSSPSREKIPLVRTRSMRAGASVTGSQDHDRAEDLAAFHLVERLLHLVEFDRFRHKSVEI